MKLPSYDRLSKEQDRIYNLPLTSNYLITGPPGTGKTVIALYRASMYKTQKLTPILLSYSKLLAGYTGDAAGSLRISAFVKTYHNWAYTTYRKYFHEAPPQLRPYVFDWVKITPKLFSRLLPDKPYLLVDEGQDLPPQFYAAATLLSNNLTVFADENQRITDTQSTFDDIRKYARISIKDEHKLTTNYRNTKQIAEVAACYYAGLPSGKPDLPKTEGELPVIQNTSRLDEAVDFIIRYERLNPHRHIGVFTKSSRLQRKILEMLNGRTKNPVGYYDSADGILPSFTAPGIKLIMFPSAQGLEFDAVFIPEIQAINMDTENSENKMTLYVLLSRARENLFLQYSGKGKPSVLNLIPDKLVEYR